MTRVVISATKDLSDYNYFSNTLRVLNPSVVIHGKEDPVAEFAIRWCMENSVRRDGRDDRKDKGGWKQFNRRCLGEAGVIVLFGALGRGAHLAKIARRNGLPTFKVDPLPGA